MEVKSLPERMREEAKTIDYYPPTPLDIGDVMREAADKLEQQNKILEVAWNVRREQFGYNPCPDLVLRKNEQDRLWKLLDEWKRMSDG